MNAQSYCMSCGVEMPQVKPIVFEITERQFLGNLDSLEADLQPLLDFGFRLALDDFGSGYTSLAMMAEYPLDTIKIDRVFASELESSPEATAIVRAVLALGKSLSIPVLAEGVETPAQLQALRQLGCEQFQGYLFSRPLSAIQLVNWLRSDHQSVG